MSKADRIREIAENNSSALSRIISDSLRLIQKQGRGCYIEDYGVDYVNTKENIRDSIGVLVPFYSNGKLKRHYGLISEEAQKPIVRIIQKTYHVNVTIQKEYERLILVLQELQYNHDESFDNGKNDMNKFIELCNKLENALC